MFRSLINYLRRHHIGLLALLVAMGGTAYAAESINGRDIVDGAVKGKDLKNGTVQGRDIENESLNGSHIDEGTLEDNVRSATVGINNNGFLQLITADGFEDVSALAAGLYQLELSPGQSTVNCDFGTTFLPGTISSSDQAASITVNAEGDSIEIQIRDKNGEPVALDGDSGVSGFSLVANCPPPPE